MGAAAMTETALQSARDPSGKTGNGEPGLPPPRAKQDVDLQALRERLAALAGKQIFFVGGAEKSGTSWLQRLLDLHPEVSCGGESHFALSLLPALRKALEDHNRFVLDKKQNPFLHQLGETHPTFDHNDVLCLLATAISLTFIKHMNGRSPKAIGERTTANARVFSGLAALYPGAKCVHIVRDPRDAAVSSYHHARRFAPAELRSQMLSKPDYVVHYLDVWEETIVRALAYAEKHPDRYFEFRYEDLVERTAPTLAGIFRFLGVDDSEEIADRCARAASFEKLSGGRVRGEENEDSFFRVGVAGDWRNHLDASTNDRVIAKVGTLMKRFGYL